MADKITKAVFLEIGYRDGHDLRERVLEEAGLSRPAKAAISLATREAEAAGAEDDRIAVTAAAAD